MLFPIPSTLQRSLGSAREASDTFRVLGLTFGLFAGTLTRGGGFSAFETRYKWLILPNIELAERADDLQALDSPIDGFGIAAEVMEIIYARYKPSLNKGLSAELRRLDSVVLGAMSHHKLVEVGAGDVIGPKLRVALDQVLRVRNSARVELRAGRGIENYFAKAAMLSRMVVNLREKDGAKEFADFIIASDPPESFKHFIANQKKRLQLTTIGFPIVDRMLSQEITR
jgi:hypothetical protein